MITHLANLAPVRPVIESINKIKEDLMDSMIVTDSPVAYINGEKIVGEGFVLKNSSIIMKLVNRSVFAFANFNTIKSW